MNEIAYPLTQISRYTCMQVDKVVYYCQSLPPPLPQTDKKLKIYTWYVHIYFRLRSLSQQQQEQIFSFTSYFRVHLFLKMFKLDQKQIHEYLELATSPYAVNVKNELCQYYYVRDCHRLDASQKEAQKVIYPLNPYILDITYISDLEWLFDTLTLKGDIEKIIESFELISKGTIFTKKESIDTREEEEYSEITFQEQKLPCTLAELIIIQIEKAILIKFYQHEHHIKYTKQDNLFNFHQIQLNFQDINFQQEYQCFSQQSDQDQKFIDEKCLFSAWNLHVKRENIQIHQIQSQISLFTLNQEWIFQVPLKYTSNLQLYLQAHEALLFCKYLATKQLKLLYPLKKPPEEIPITYKKPALTKLKIFQQPQATAEVQQQPVVKKQLKQVSQYFTNSEKSKILPEDQRLFSTNKEEHEQQLHEFSTQFVKRVFDTVITELEHFKQYKKKLKKSKNQKKPQPTEVTEIKQQPVQQEVVQEDEWNDKPKSKKQRKKQLEKQRKKDNMERKKQKQLSEQSSAQKQEEKEEISSKCSSKKSEDEIDQIGQQEEDKKENIIETLIPTTTTSAPDDEGDYVEVLNRKQHKLSQKRTETLKSKKQHQKKEKEFKDDQSLPDECQPMPQLKKGSSQSVQKNGYQFEQIDKPPQQQRIKLKKKEKGVNAVNQGVRMGLVKSIAQQKELKAYDYDLDKKILEKIYRTILEQKITNDVLSIYRKELDQFNKFKAAREISILRAQHVIKSHFRQQNVEAQIFGSSITGLALQDSDVDMVVSGLLVYTKQQLYEPMRQIIDVMNQMEWTVSCKHIFQATVPLIKVIIDPSIGFLQVSGRPIYYIMNRRNPDELNLRPGEFSQQIQIDITFELAPPYPQYQMYPPYQQAWQGYHIGLKSTEFTNQICTSIHGFSEVAIFLKKLLKIKDLNDSYTGGVSSFCLTIMLAAIGQDHSIGQKLINFLNKYGLNFDPQKWAIYLDEKGQNNFYNIEDEQTNQPLTIFSPINLQKIQINVTKIQSILSLFQQLYVEVMQNIDQIEPSLQKKISQKELQDYYNNHQIQKLVDLVSWQSLNLFENYLQ